MIDFLIYNDNIVNTFNVQCVNYHYSSEIVDANNILTNTKLCSFDLSFNKEDENVIITVSNFSKGDIFKIVARDYISTTIPISMNSIVKYAGIGRTEFEKFFTIKDLEPTKTVILNINEIDDNVILTNKNNVEINIQGVTSLKLESEMIINGRFCIEKYQTASPPIIISFQLLYLDSIKEHEKIFLYMIMVLYIKDF